MNILARTMNVACASLPLAVASMASAAPITFQVNMEVQQIIGAFNPATHTVEVRGGFNGWNGGTILTASAANTNIYEVTVDIAGTPGSQVEYKFVINQVSAVVWEGFVGMGIENRAVTLTESPQTLPVVHFNNQSTPPNMVAVTFQVNMEVQMSTGNFDPSAHGVEARGSFDNWGVGITLAPSSGNTNIYQGTANVPGAAGTMIEHKYVINKAGTLFYEGNVGPGGPFGNRVFTLSSPPSQTLPVVYFNNFTNNVGAIPVTFRVNMGVQAARGTFDPASGTMYVAGPFNNWSPTGTQLTNTLADPYVYTGTVGISGVSPGGTVGFKFVANGGTWEAGDDRTFVLAESAQTLPVEYFDRIPDLGRLTITQEPNPFDVVVTLAWSGSARIRLQTSTSLTGPWEDVPNTAGAGNAILTYDQNPGTRFFRLIGP